ncbi:hypothetical protein Patl1_20723 [Pistacia atlantica]|uniref:Uncharacterized protein n=1 Tax=Pistacia atlantica TaxID=434234 RepID=A0ACC1BMF6_9ROSI|nr:hypothetical protein Patl1_20723 [Pistacia atlantica]
MDVKEIVEPKGELTLPPPPAFIVAIAVKGNRKSKNVISWTLEKFVPEGITLFKLLHVCPRITAVPTPMGNFIPISQIRDDVAAAYKQEVEWQRSKMLQPYKKMCVQKKEANEIDIEQDEHQSSSSNFSFSKYINISQLKIKKDDLSSRISLCTPSFCTIYAVSKGKLSSIRPPHLATNKSIKDDCSYSFSNNSSSSYSSSSQTDLHSVSSYSHFHSPSLPIQRFQALSTVNNTLLRSTTNSTEPNHSRCQSLDSERGQDSMNSMSSYLSSSGVGQPVSRSSSYLSLVTDNQSSSEHVSISDGLTDCSSSVSQMTNLNKRQLEEAAKLKEIHLMEEKALESARLEKEKYEAAKRDAECVRECAEREVLQRREAELQALHEAKEKEKFENALVGSVQQYQEFTWEEIASATSSFSENLKIGMGAYGTVYKCNLHHTTAAVKVLRSKGNHENKQFQQEIEILSRIRHPHLLLLLGACTAHGCLIYEYMENGSLEDRLYQKNNTPPIPWFDRFRIAWEVASALVFLHNSKPKPIIHRDLKPANILLNHNLVSKIGDVGLSTMVNSDSLLVSSAYMATGPVGTLSYMDPEYQRTGLISPKSDVYAFGMVILQLLTAKTAIALAHMVETAIEEDTLVEILDSQAGNWPTKEAKELAVLGLSCAELRRRDRPDLKDQILPALKRLKDVADRARDSDSSIKPAAPTHFICPILKDVMREPCVAADGYTYDREAMEEWLQKNDKSPMTNLPLANKDLLPNYSLLSAIMEWKSKQH